MRAASLGVMSLLLSIACGEPTAPVSEVPPSPPPIAAPQCRLQASPDRLELLRNESATVDLSVEDGPCVVDRVTIPDVFELVDPPELPFVVDIDTPRTVRVVHRPAFFPPAGRPVGELQFLTRGRLSDHEPPAVVLLVGAAAPHECIHTVTPYVFFPLTTKGDVASFTLFLANRCTEPIRARNLSIRGSSAFSVEPAQAFEIPPEGGQRLSISFQPQGPGVLYSAWLTYRTDEAGAPVRSIRLSGESGAPDAELFPPALDMGAVVVRGASDGMRSACSQRRFARFHATGAARSRITSVRLSGADAAAFDVVATIEDEVQTPPFEVPVVRSARFEVTFSPLAGADAAQSAVVEVHHDGPVTPLQVLVRGSTLADGPRRDTFVRPTTPRADILFVIDDTGTMRPRSEQIEAFLDTFVAALDRDGVDYQLGFINADSRATDTGRLRRCADSTSLVRSIDLPGDRRAALLCLRPNAYESNYTESGLGAASRALTRALLPGPNESFLRDESRTIVVVISDEDDQSLESDELLTLQFRSLRGGGPRAAVVHAIAGPVAQPCETRTAAPGFRYFRMTEETGGVFGNICLDDWTPQAEGIVRRLSLPVRAFELSSPAAAATIEVRVDGAVMPAAAGWVYDGASVRFEAAALPPPGAQIDVRYEPRCLP